MADTRARAHTKPAGAPSSPRHGSPEDLGLVAAGAAAGLLVLAQRGRPPQGGDVRADLERTVSRRELADHLVLTEARR